MGTQANIICWTLAAGTAIGIVSAPVLNDIPGFLTCPPPLHIPCINDYFDCGVNAGYQIIQANTSSAVVLKNSFQNELTFPVIGKVMVHIRMMPPIEFEPIEDENGFV